ncbi:putative tail protein [Proteus phage vB_PmiM_ZX7]|nr:putative tail protein [Proteus phage vB_PmiM_ZX7]
MNIQDKPDYKVFASEARGGEVTDFPNLERGWGETIDKTEKIPPMEWFNLVGKRADEWLLYLTQRGVAEWDAKVKYPQYAMCQLGGRFYIAIEENENRNPVNSQAVWIDLAKYLGVDGKLDVNKVVQTTGQSTTNVMSQKAVTDAIPKVNLNTALKQKHGWWKCGDTGIIYQWGQDRPSGSDEINVKFKIRFPNGVFSVVGSVNDPGSKTSDSAICHSINQDGFKLRVLAGSEWWSGLSSWFAIGY